MRTVRKPIRVALNAQESEGGELWAGKIRTRSVSVDILKRGYLGLTVLSDDALPGCDHEKHPQRVTWGTYSPINRGNRLGEVARG